jgi:hypothetical protein
MAKTKVIGKKQGDAFTEALFAEYSKAYQKTKPGKQFPEWLTEEQMGWVKKVIKEKLGIV